MSQSPFVDTRRSIPGRYSNLAFALAFPFAVALGFVVGCSSGNVEHPWLTLDDPSHRIVEVSEMNPGQVVIVLDPPVDREEALAVGRSVQAQAPEGAQVNARIYDDDRTARNWRTAPEDLALRHLLVVVQIVPSTGTDRVRWVGPEGPEA